jgi:hypothetical protein
MNPLPRLVQVDPEHLNLMPLKLEGSNGVAVHRIDEHARHPRRIPRGEVRDVREQLVDVIGVERPARWGSNAYFFLGISGSLSLFTRPTGGLFARVLSVCS